MRRRRVHRRTCARPMFMKANPRTRRDARVDFHASHTRSDYNIQRRWLQPFGIALAERFHRRRRLGLRRGWPGNGDRVPAAKPDAQRHRANQEQQKEQGLPFIQLARRGVGGGSVGHFFFVRPGEWSFAGGDEADGGCGVRCRCGCRRSCRNGRGRGSGRAGGRRLDRWFGHTSSRLDRELRRDANATDADGTF